LEISPKSQYNIFQFYFKLASFTVHVHSNRFISTKRPYSRTANKFYFSAVLEWSVSNFEKYIEARKIDEQESSVYTVGNSNNDISSEEHFENSNTKRGTYLLLKLFIFDKIFEFYLVTQSL
jgi:hypothetical protein